MHAITFLQDLAVVMIVAAFITILFHRLKQPVVLGYIFAGVIIGPYTLSFPSIKNEESIHTLSELGLIFLMFSLGLEFSLRKLKKVGGTALVAATLEILFMLGLGYQIGRWFSWSVMDSVFLGAMLSISSTTIIVKALSELGKSKEKFAQLIFGILIVEDILAIALIALLSGVAVTGSLPFSEAIEMVVRLSVFFVVTLVVGLLVVPRLLSYVNRFKSNEMLLITVLGLCFGVSLLAVKLNYSVAIGAFLIGAIIAEAREIGKIEHLTEPLRDMFSAIFFVTIGMMIEPHLIMKYAWPITVITVAVVLGKVVTCFLGTFVTGNGTRTSLRVGMGLAQIGEFSFIIAALGLSLKVTSEFLYPIAITVSAITTFLTPYLIKSSDKWVDWFDHWAPKPLVNSLELYTHWLGQKVESPKSSVKRFTQKWSWQIVLNAFLITGVFIGVIFLSRLPLPWLDDFIREERVNAMWWLVAMIVSLPLMIAIYRKLQALGMLLADARAKTVQSGFLNAKAIISTTVPLIGMVGLGILIFLLSSVLLPSGNIVWVLLAILVGVAALFWRSFIKVYSKAQVALVETLASTPSTQMVEVPRSLKGLLQEAKLKLTPITHDSLAKGRLIRELELRTQTGASIIAIEREGVNLINPDANEELQVGDKVLLLGEEEQLKKAKAYFTGK